MLTPEDLRRIEIEHPDGLSSRQVIETLRAHGVTITEATFRKYVQLGLLPRSTRRVGEKGKHKGSRGVYPVGTVRRLGLIKKMMDEGMTLEEIRHSFLAFRNDLDALQEALDVLFRGLERHLGAREMPVQSKRKLAKEVRDTRRSATGLVRRLERLASSIAATPVVQEKGEGATG